MGSAGSRVAGREIGPRVGERRTDLGAILPAYAAVEVRDPTGAGDSFAGGMMGHLARVGEYDFHRLIRAMAYGIVMASFTVEDFSLRRLERLTADEIEDRLHKYRDMLQLG